jgi:phosphatidylglycerophosphatase A
VWIFTGFTLFRIFDICKPWPVSWADRRIDGGLGVMLDDVVAGIYAAIALALLLRLV